MNPLWGLLLVAATLPGFKVYKRKGGVAKTAPVQSGLSPGDVIAAEPPPDAG